MSMLWAFAGNQTTAAEAKQTNKEHIKKRALIATLVTIYSSAQENQKNVLLITSAGSTSLQQPHFFQQAKVRLSTCRVS